MKYNKFLAVSMSAILSLTLVGCSTTSSAKELKGEELNKIQKDDKEKENYLVIDLGMKRLIKKVTLNTQLTFHYQK